MSKRDSEATIAPSEKKKLSDDERGDSDVEAIADELDDVFEDDHDEAEHGEHELAPLPDIKRARSKRSKSRTGSFSDTKNVRTSSFSSTAGRDGLRPRPRAFSAGAGAGGIVTTGGEMPSSEPIERQNGFSNLGRSASRVSTISNTTFADAASLVNMPGITRVETRMERRARARAGTVTTLASLARHTSIFSEGISEVDEKKGEYDPEMEEELVAVQVLDDGQEIAYPDGGLEAWLVLLGGVCAAVCAFGLAASVGAFQSYYKDHLLKEYTSSQIAWIGSTQAAVCFAACLFTGPLFDRYGCRPLLAGGTVLLVLAFCMLSLCTKYYQIFLCHATLMAMGMDLMFIVPMGAVGQWFFLRRGLAFGILMMGSSAGAIIWPVIMANLPQQIGFGWTVRLIALLVGLLGLAATFLIRTRLPARPPGSYFHFDEFKNPAYAFVACSFPCLVFGFFSYLTFIGSYGNLVGLGTLAPYLLMITNGSSGFGRVTAGLVADKIGTFNVAIIGMAGMVVLMFAWLAMKTAPALIALCVLYGFLSGAPVSLQGPMVTASATDPRQAGTLIGQALMVQSFAQLCGPPIFGAIVGAGSREDQLARFPHAIAFGASMLAVSACLIAAARFYKNPKLLAIV